MIGCSTYTHEPGRGTSTDWYSGVGSKLCPFSYNFTFGQIIGPALSDEPTQLAVSKGSTMKTCGILCQVCSQTCYSVRDRSMEAISCLMKCAIKFSYISVTVVKFLKAHNCGTFFLFFTINYKQSRWTTAVTGWWERFSNTRQFAKQVFVHMDVAKSLWSYLL